MDIHIYVDVIIPTLLHTVDVIIPPLLHVRGVFALSGC